MTAPTSIEPTDLPATIRRYLAAHAAGDADTALRAFHPDAVVVDDGRTFRGSGEIHDFLSRAAAEYTYTTELVGAQRVDDEHWVATNRLEGDFPGGVVELGYTFRLAGELIAELVIAPPGPDRTEPIPDDQPVRNVVLVHGAFADGSGWRGVHERLSARGYRVSIVQNPLTSLTEDVAATRRVLDRQTGPTILVGHSWGGTVITEAGGHPNVAGLVYVSALSPDAGETTSQQYEGFAATPDFVIDIGDDGYGFLDADKFQVGFAHDADDAQAAFLRDSQVPINMSVFGTPLAHAAWRTKPSWAVIATEDHAFDLAMLRHMAERMRADVTEVAASHALFLTQPDVVADTIHRAAQGAVVRPG